MTTTAAPASTSEVAGQLAGEVAGEVAVDDVAALVQRWLREAADQPTDAAATQLASLLRDPAGLGFATGFVDGVVRPEDPAAGAAVLRRIVGGGPGSLGFLPAPLRAAVRAGGVLAPVAPGVVVPVAKLALRRMVGHLVVDATDARLGRSLARIRAQGLVPGGDGASTVRLNLNLLGEAVLGRREADRRLAGLRALVARDDVDYVSVKTSAVVAPHAPWAFDEAVDHVVARLAPLYELAASTPAPALGASSSSTFLNLDMEEYKDLDLTTAVFTRLLDLPQLRDYSGGIVLQAYLPDALGAMQQLQEWAATRVARGGAPVKVRLVKGANLSMERVEADVHGWPLATWGSKAESDAHYKRVLEWALTPERTAAVRLGVAGHNLFDIAHAWLLAGARGVRTGGAVDVEMLLGMASGQAAAVRRDVGSLLLYTPVVHPAEFDVAIAYLVRRLEEVASPDNFMSAITELSERPDLLARERGRYEHSRQVLAGWRAQALADHGDVDAPPPAHRRYELPADRYTGLPHAPGSPEGFVGTPDSDPAVAAHRTWVREALGRARGSRLGLSGPHCPAQTVVDDARALDAALASVAAAGARWGARPASERARVLHEVGRALEARRAELVEVMAAEAGKTADQADPEISEAVDFAHYYADRALELEQLERRDGVRAVPARLTLVTPPWNFPVAIPAGGVLAALAAGSGVVLKPAEPAQRCGAVLAEAIASALRSVGGADTSADELPFRVLTVDEGGLGRQLVAHRLVDRVILTGAYATAELFRRFRADLPLLAETSGKNAVVVTPSADLDLAAKDVVASAFGHAGQKCSAASLVVLVGSVGTSRRFHDQLLDAASSLVVGAPWDPTTQLGPVIEEPVPGSALHWGLTELEPGQSWALEPRPVDLPGEPSLRGRLWTPGIRAGVARGSRLHRTEVFGPVLGIMTAATLEEAIDVVNEVDYGLTSGIHSLDVDELRRWAARVQAGNLYVNRGTTGAIVQRQPFGGWSGQGSGRARRPVGRATSWA